MLSLSLGAVRREREVKMCPLYRLRFAFTTRASTSSAGSYGRVLQSNTWPYGAVTENTLLRTTANQSESSAAFSDEGESRVQPRAQCAIPN